MKQNLKVACLVGVGMVVSRLSAADPTPYCSGEYGEDLGELSPQAREIEAKAATYSFAVRTSATYECVSYDSDGSLKRSRRSAIAYGTAFGYRHDGGDTLLLTNDHVAEWPAVTDDDHPVEGVPAGCKRIADALAIVDDDHDDYAADDIPLSRVAVDPALDVAVLRAHAALGVIPWRIGKSAALVARDAVVVRGFPLGEFRATNVGKVVSAYDHDEQGEWNHDDFVVDALLTSGGSGSPVLAVSCRTHELELVGIFHAHYAAASALNVVVAIDQVHDLMTTLKRRPSRDPAAEPDAAARVRLVDAVHRAATLPLFPLGPLVASVWVRDDGALVFGVFPNDFPRTTQPILAIEDLPPSVDTARSFGRLGAVYVGGADGLRSCPAAGIDAETQASVGRTLALLRKDALATFDVRAAAAAADRSRDAFESAARQRRAYDRMLGGQREATQAAIELAAKLTSDADGTALSLGQLERGEALAAAR